MRANARTVPGPKTRKPGFRPIRLGSWAESPRPPGGSRPTFGARVDPRCGLEACSTACRPRPQSIAAGLMVHVRCGSIRSRREGRIESDASAARRSRSGRWWPCSWPRSRRSGRPAPRWWPARVAGRRPATSWRGPGDALAERGEAVLASAPRWPYELGTRRVGRPRPPARRASPQRPSGRSTGSRAAISSATTSGSSGASFPTEADRSKARDRSRPARAAPSRGRPDRDPGRRRDPPRRSSSRSSRTSRRAPSPSGPPRSSSTARPSPPPGP